VNAASRRRSAEQLTGELQETGVRFRCEERLARYTTIGLGGPAEVMAFPASAEQLVKVVNLVGELDFPVRVLGGGSNLLVSDDGVRGLVIHTGAMKISGFDEGGRLEAEAGVHFPGLVRAAVSRGLRGLEGGVGIPGSLGGVLAMNAGAYGFSIGEVVEQVTVVSLDMGKIELARDQVDFRYRSSSFGENAIVAKCRLRLIEDDPEAVRVDMERQLEDRKTSQPVGVKSAGCIFKNPPGDSAGRIIDELGLKGLRIGGARVSEVHANFIVHDGDARTEDVFALIEEIQERVCQTTSIELEKEVKQWL
jgi:UDP-N-acetylmuramate dehydrogenase